MKKLEELVTTLEGNPIIAGAVDEEGLEVALRSNCDVIFLQFGDLCNVGELVSRIEAAGKISFLNVDLLDGVSSKNIVIEFLKRNTHLDGIISAKNHLLRAGKAVGFLTIQRFFLVDSMSLSNMPKQISTSDADIVEIMPGYSEYGIHLVLRDMKTYGLERPLIASGLVCNKNDAIKALSAGALAISTTCRDIWAEA